MPGATDPNAARLDAVSRYLTENFPEADVLAPTDFGGAAKGRVFSIEYGDYSTHQLELGRSVYEDRNAVQLITLLDTHAVAATMQANPDRRLVIASTAGGGVQCHVEVLRR
ncbi:MAG: hypothetical protein ACREJ9_09195 [Candidatus Rokuibacteriota bacterium]